MGTLKISEPPKTDMFDRTKGSERPSGSFPPAGTPTAQLHAEGRAELERHANAERDRMNALGHAPTNPIHIARHH